MRSVQVIYFCLPFPLSVLWYSFGSKSVEWFCNGIVLLCLGSTSPKQMHDSPIQWHSGQHNCDYSPQSSAQLLWNSKKFLDTVIYLFTVGVEQVNTTQSTWIKMWCVNGGACRRKAITDLHFKKDISGKNEPTRSCFIIFEIAWDHFLITVLQKLK
jgi:hypothetical protein